MVKLFYGNEPYSLDYEKGKVKKSCKEQMFFLQEMGSWDEKAEMFSSQIPCFGQKNVIMLSVEKLKADEKLLEFVKRDSKYCDLYIFASAADRNTKVYKEIAKSHEAKRCDKLEEALLKKWVMEQAKRKGFSITADAYELLVRRKLYYQDKDCTLYTLQKCIEVLGYADRAITKKLVEENIEETCDEKVFVLSNLLLNRQEEKLFFVARQLLEEENPIAMLSAILRTYRLAFKASLYMDKTEKERASLLGVPSYQYIAATKYSAKQLKDGMDILQSAVGKIKAGYPKEAIFYTTLGEMLLVGKE